MNLLFLGLYIAIMIALARRSRSIPKKIIASIIAIILTSEAIPLVWGTTSMLLVHLSPQIKPRSVNFAPVSQHFFRLVALRLPSWPQLRYIVGSVDYPLPEFNDNLSEQARRIAPLSDKPVALVATVASCPSKHFPNQRICFTAYDGRASQCSFNVTDERGSIPFYDYFKREEYLDCDARKFNLYGFIGISGGLIFGPLDRLFDELTSGSVSRRLPSFDYYFHSSVDVAASELDGVIGGS